MDILPVLESYGALVEVLCKQVKCSRCQKGTPTAAYPIPGTSNEISCKECYTLEDGECSGLSGVNLLARCGIYVFGTPETLASDLRVFISQGAAQLCMNPHNDTVTRGSFGVGTIYTVEDTLTCYLEWDKVRRVNMEKKLAFGAQPWALGQGAWDTPSRSNRFQKEQPAEGDWDQQLERNEMKEWQKSQYEQWKKRKAEPMAVAPEDQKAPSSPVFGSNWGGPPDKKLDSGSGWGSADVPKPFGSPPDDK